MTSFGRDRASRWGGSSWRGFDSRAAEDSRQRRCAPGLGGWVRGGWEAAVDDGERPAAWSSDAGGAWGHGAPRRMRRELRGSATVLLEVEVRHGRAGLPGFGEKEQGRLTARWGRKEEAGTTWWGRNRGKGRNPAQKKRKRKW
ncbi:hypothetical protein BRADI_5g13953v3 [Brachypodium distachyon]|uniref:Uncharacterized protein n=1 Tax=Brachypodium distachyon TaxID=15368 RepID=A0A0Q3E5V1_BRADI|nr:hypothetical protein BRADI_5g13953v3 [Brachypodium distachyon]